MSYVGEPFVHDIFVSYSHGVPDGTGVSRIRQWSQGFARELERELRTFPQFGRDLKVFIDQDHRPSQGVDPLEPLTDQLRSDIEHTAILAVLMSPHYLQSKWCASEREWWSEAQRKSQLQQDGRIAVVRMWHSEDQWPRELTDARGEPIFGFCFYDMSAVAYRPQPYGWPDPAAAPNPKFQEELLNLVGRIALKLDEIKNRVAERRRAQENAQRLAAAGGQVVYLHGREESAAAWTMASATLQEAGLAVVPGEPDPVVRDPQKLQEIRRLRVEAMADCDALLLVAGQDGRATDADLVVVGKHDRNSARARSNRLLPCALLDAVGAPIATATRRATARSLNVEWIDATQPTWPPAVHAWLTGSSDDEANQ